MLYLYRLWLACGAASQLLHAGRSWAQHTAQRPHLKSMWSYACVTLRPTGAPEGLAGSHEHVVTKMPLAGHDSAGSIEKPQAQSYQRGSDCGAAVMMAAASAPTGRTRTCAHARMHVHERSLAATEKVSWGRRP